MKTTTDLNTKTILVEKNESEISPALKHRHLKFIADHANLLKSRLGVYNEICPDANIENLIQEVSEIEQRCKSENILLFKN